jgi:Amt family ammonium transporter
MKKGITFLIASLVGVSTFAANESSIDTGDTAWMLMSTALVMMMTPAGLALFYSGLTQNKSVLNTIGMSFVSFCTGVIAWIILGYSFGIF